VDPEIRDGVIDHLAKRGIESRPFFFPAHTLPMYPGRDVFPVAERLGASGINLPSWPGLSEAQVDEVATAVVSGIGALGGARIAAPLQR
jgi:perosamine synthetase